MAHTVKKKSVLIVGAGPAGLVAAKTFKQYGYAVSVYEAADRVGGMWRDERGGSGDKCSPNMRTNLSRFTVAFSDLSWTSVNLSDMDGSTPGGLPMFLRAWQVGRYLETYAKEFDITPCLSLRRRVVNAFVEEDQTWKIVSEDVSGELDMRTFDHLIVASGFFNKPAHTFDPSPTKDLSNIQHSSRFRDLPKLTSSPGKVVVIGGGISGSEAAAQAAFQISNAEHAPSKTKPAHAASKVYHIINRPFYCLPRYLPQDPQISDGKFNPAPKFLPLDLVMYNLSRRGGEDISAAITTIPPEKAQKGHEFIRTASGGDQSDVGHLELVYQDFQMRYPAYTGITDTYLEFVRSGVIVPVKGWVEEVTQKGDSDRLNIHLKQYDPWYHAPENEATSNSTLVDIVGIIEATGYKSDLSWLDSRVQDILNEGAAPNARIPFLLSRGSILSSRVPTIGFIGFYEGPFWGVMEMQARFLAETWTNHPPSKQRSLPNRDIYEHDTTKRMQEAINEQSQQVPQFWMADYVGLIEELSRDAGATRDDSAFNGQQAGPAFPARYQSNDTGPQAKNVVAEVGSIIKASNETARFVAAAVFTGMQGLWTIHRTIQSRTDTPGGTFTGTAHFHPREPTSPTYTAEYLYIEHGTFTMDTGLSFPATRRYIYRYNEATDKITSWFTQEDDESVGALFNTWGFFVPEEGEGKGWMAKGHHWCDPDTYQNMCEFRFNGAKVERFMIRYSVKGPKKAYEHESWYERAERGG